MASKRGLRRRACGDKRGYPTEDCSAIKAHLWRLRQMAPDPKLIKAYECSFCGRFHVGHVNRKHA